MMEAGLRNSIPCTGTDMSEKNSRTGNHFTIVELGFGSGLNFLLTAQEITKDPDLYLHYIGIESRPISDKDWSIFDAQRQNLKYAGKFRRQYP